MLFKRYHIFPMIIGMKVQTRRIWKSRHVRVGHEYPVTHKMFYNPEDIVGYVRVNSVERIPLGVMTEDDAYAEGGYDLPSYYNVLSDISGESKKYTPILKTTPVWVVKFTFRLSDMIDPNGGDWQKKIYYGEWVEHMKKYDRLVMPFSSQEEGGEWTPQWVVLPIQESGSYV